VSDSSVPISIRLARSLYDRVPTTVTESLSPLYFRYQSRSADFDHESPERRVRRRDDAPDHVLVVVIDALRPDFVPDLSLPFTHAITPSTWTFPTVTSLHTGLYPSEHGAVAHTQPDDEQYAMPRQSVGRYPTLPTELEAAGYDTFCGCAFVVPFLALRGQYQTHKLYGDGDAGTLVSDYRNWRRGRDRTFGYVHLGDIHDPIRPPSSYLRKHDARRREEVDTDPCVSFDDCPECRAQRDEHMARYRAAFDYVEDRLESLLREVGDDTLVVVTGDHGEGQGEHFEFARRFTDSRPNGGGGRRGNIGHGGTPFDVVARVPVGISTPGDRSLLPEGGWPSLCDVAPTILAETVSDPRITGSDWQTPIPDDRAVLCEGVRFGVERKAVYRGSEKVIKSAADDVTLTAEVERATPGERFGETSVRNREELLDAMTDSWEDFDVTEAVGPFVREQLDALGYK
jgi:hypothetical protein